jgi:hypothetical protein
LKPETHVRTTLLKINSLPIIQHEPVNFAYGNNCCLENYAIFTHAFKGDTAEFLIDLVNGTSIARCVVNGYVQCVLQPVQETKLRSDAVNKDQAGWLARSVAQS